MSSGFLKNLKVGDRVGITSRNDLRVDYVKRITKTMIILQKLGRYKKDNGSIVGGDIWSTTSLVEATEEFITRYDTMYYRRSIHHCIREGSLNKLTFKELKTVYKILSNTI